MLLPSQKIREIWQEMKELDNIRKGVIISDISNQVDFEKRTLSLEKKYEDIEISFGHESTLMKATLYYLDSSDYSKCVHEFVANARDDGSAFSICRLCGYRP